TVGHAARAKADRSVDGILQDFGDRVLTFADWPPKSRRYVPPVGGRSEYDQVVRVHALNLTSDFFKKNEGSEDPVKQAQLVALRHLYFQSQFISEDRYVPTKELLRILRESLGEKMSVH